MLLDNGAPPLAPSPLYSLSSFSLPHSNDSAAPPPDYTSAPPPAFEDVHHAGPITYEDEYVTLTANGALRVKRLFISEALDWTFGIGGIKDLWRANGRTDKLGETRKPLKRWEVKGWGVGPTGIVWARSRTRYKHGLLATRKTLENSLVMSLESGWYFRIGFSVTDPQVFFMALNEVRATRGLEQFAF
ncbi:hypothetical protein JCM21900_001265 [Sporobolomyces salmonicolor]